MEKLSGKLTALQTELKEMEAELKAARKEKGAKGAEG
jgi:hypothetical protein